MTHGNDERIHALNILPGSQLNAVKRHGLGWIGQRIMHLDMGAGSALDMRHFVSPKSAEATEVFCSAL